MLIARRRALCEFALIVEMNKRALGRGARPSFGLIAREIGWQRRQVRISLEKPVALPEHLPCRGINPADNRKSVPKPFIPVGRLFGANIVQPFPAYFSIARANFSNR